MRVVLRVISATAQGFFCFNILKSTRSQTIKGIRVVAVGYFARVSLCVWKLAKKRFNFRYMLGYVSSMYYGDPIMCNSIVGTHPDGYISLRILLK